MDRLFATIKAEESIAARRWFARLQENIRLLRSAPHMGTISHDDPARRQIIYGNKPHFYRIIYKVDDPQHLVTVIQIRHGKQSSPSQPKL
jgi:plasmid stabilization system protein ParE